MKNCSGRLSDLFGLHHIRFNQLSEQCHYDCSGGLRNLFGLHRFAFEQLS